MAISYALGFTLRDKFESGVCTEVHEIVVALSRSDLTTENRNDENKNDEQNDKMKMTSTRLHDFPFLTRRHKLKTNRRINLNFLAGLGKLARRLIDTEDDDVVGYFIGRKQVFSGRIDGKATRHDSPGERMFDRRQSSLLW